MVEPLDLAALLGLGDPAVEPVDGSTPLGGEPRDEPLNLDSLGLGDGLGLGEPAAEPFGWDGLVVGDVANEPLDFEGLCLETPAVMEALDLDQLLVGDVARPFRGHDKLLNGFAYKSPAYAREISRMRWQPHRENLAREEVKLRGDVRVAWDSRVARIGDSALGVLRGHANTNTMDFICRDAFRQVGAGSTSQSRGETDLDNTSHKLMTLLTAASLVWSRLSLARRFLFTSLRDASTKARTAIVINRYSDSTPVFMRYGHLQSQLMSKARYVKEIKPDRPDGYSRYTTCSWEEWRKLHPHARPQMGILEFFGQSADVTWQHGDDGDVGHQSFFFPPNVLRRATGDCTMTAHTRAFLSHDQLRDLGNSSMLLVNDTPDNCRANLRFKRRMLDETGPDVFYDEFSGCVAHKLHTYTTKAISEEKLVGHIHATQTVLGITSRQQTLEEAFTRLVEQELEIIPGNPPSEYAPLLESVLDHTMLRAREIVRARSGETEPEQHKVLHARVQPLKVMANGNIRRPRCQHYCNGCCLDSDGIYSRRIAVENFASAFITAGVFSNSGTHAMKSRWLSTSGGLSMLLAGLLLHNILPRAWHLAWPKWHIIRNPDEGDDFHRLVRSKVYRAKLWMSADNVVVKCLGQSIGVSVADHCLQRLTHLDAKGGLLQSVATRSGCPLRECFSTCQLFLTSPLDTSAVMLNKLFEHLGLDVVNIAYRNFFSVVLALAGRIWFYLISMYDAWPYKLIRIALLMAEGSRDAAASLAKEFLTANDCCLDRGISFRVLSSEMLSLLNCIN